MSQVNKAEAVSRLRAHEADLRAMGIVQLSLFGSVARGEQGGASDIDLAAVLNEDFRVGAFQFMRIEDDVAQLLGRSVDLVTEPADASALQDEIDRDRVRVF